MLNESSPSFHHSSVRAGCFGYHHHLILVNCLRLPDRRSEITILLACIYMYIFFQCLSSTDVLDWNFINMNLDCMEKHIFQFSPTQCYLCLIVQIIQIADSEELNNLYDPVKISARYYDKARGRFYGKNQIWKLNFIVVLHPFQQFQLHKTCKTCKKCFCASGYGLMATVST